MALLRVVVCLLGLVVLCHSKCTFKEFTDVANPPKECVDQNGKKHAFDSEWVIDCVECTCSSDGVSCCNLLPDQDEVDISDECELVVNKETCTAKEVLKSDKTKECPLN